MRSQKISRQIRKISCDHDSSPIMRRKLCILALTSAAVNAAILGGQSPSALPLDSRARQAALSHGRVEATNSAATLQAAAPALTVPTRSEKIGAEFVGTFILVLSVVCAGAQPAQAALAPFAVVGVITGLIFAFGHISGAIFNPAVSIALILRGRLGVQEALEFAVAQLLAAIAASLTGRVLYGVSIAPSISAPLAVANWLRAALSEVLWTGIIVTMVLHAGTTKAMEGNDVAPVAIMMAVFGCIVCASGASAAGFNPAACTGMWLAKAMTGGGFSAYHVSLYFVGPIVGSVLATALFKTVTCPNEK